MWRKVGKFFYRLARILLLLFIVLVTLLALVLKNPNWVIDFAQAELANYGIELKIHEVSGEFTGLNYALTGRVSTTDYHGIAVESADINMQVNWWQFIRFDKLLGDITVKQAALTVDPDATRAGVMQTIKRKKSEKRQGADYVENTESTVGNAAGDVAGNVAGDVAGDWTSGESRFSEIHWLFESVKVQVNDQAYTARGEGQGINTANIELITANKEALRLDYVREKSALTIQSQALDISAYTNQSAQLQQVNAQINTRDWLASQIEATVEYAGIQGDITMQGDGNDQVKMTANVADNTVELLAKRIAGGAKITFANQDLTHFMPLRDWIAEVFPVKHFSGLATGEVVYMAQQGITQADLTLVNPKVSHATGQFSAAGMNLTYQEATVDFTVAFNENSQVLPLLARGDKPLVLSGQVNGRYQVASKTLLIEDGRLADDTITALVFKGQLQEKAFEISGELTDVAVDGIVDYLPQQVNKQWLESLTVGLVSGKTNQTTFAISGPTNAFFASEASRLQIHSQIQDTVIQHPQNAQQATIAHADIAIDNRAITIDNAEVTTNGVTVVSRINIPDIQIGEAQASEVQADIALAETPIAALTELASKNGLAEAVQKINQEIDLTGSVSGDLSLLFDIKTRKWQVSAQPVIKLQKLMVARYPDIDFQAINARATIRDNQLDSAEATGRINGQSVVGDLTNKMTNKTTNKTTEKSGYEIDLKGKTDAVSWLAIFGVIDAKQHSLLSTYGVIDNAPVDSRATIRLDKHWRFVSVSGESELDGIALNGFDAITKPKQQKARTRFSYNHQTKQVDFSMEKLLDLAIQLDDRGRRIDGLLLAAGEIKPTSASTPSSDASSTNASKAVGFEANTIKIHLHSPRFDWQSFNQFYHDWLSKKGADNSATDNSARRKQILANLTVKLDINVDDLRFDKTTSFPLVLWGSLNDMTVVSPLMNGRIQYQPNQFDAQLTRLNLSQWIDMIKPKETAQDKPTDYRLGDFAKAFPQMKVAIEKIIYNDHDIGRFDFKTSINEGQYSIDEMLLTGPDYYLTISGYEDKEAQGITTKIQADFKSERTQNLISQLALNEVMEADQFDMAFDLAWPGKAHSLNIRQSYGTARLYGQNVKLTEVKPGVGGVLGLMDFGSILKRISLDFSNLTSSKLTLDTINGTWNIGGGRAVTNDFKADGSLISMQITGPTDLYRREFDNLSIVVIPSASNVLPIIGTVAGGALGAAAGVVVQQVIGDELNKVAGIPYTLYGKWLDPELKLTAAQASDENVRDSGFGDK